MVYQFKLPVLLRSYRKFNLTAISLQISECGYTHIPSNCKVLTVLSINRQSKAKYNFDKFMVQSYLYFMITDFKMTYDYFDNARKNL